MRGPREAFEQEALNAGVGAVRLEEQQVRQMVEAYLPLVAKQVGRVWLSSRIGLTRDDLLSAGAVGLLMAARNFEPSRGVDFSVFARSYIHGALMREINNAMSALGQYDPELLIPSAEIEPDSLPDETAHNGFDQTEAAEVRELMEYQLTASERLHLTLYFYEELTLAEIAAVLDSSQSSVARTIKAALLKLKNAMSGKERPAHPASTGKPLNEKKRVVA